MTKEKLSELMKQTFVSNEGCRFVIDRYDDSNHVEIRFLDCKDRLSGMISLEDAHTAVDAVKKLNQLKRVI